MREKISDDKTLALTFMSPFKNAIDNCYYMIVVCECYVG